MHTLKPTTNLLNNIVTIDARVSPLLGKDLDDLIKASVDRSQLFLHTTLPSQLIVTQKQFASLNNYTETMYHTTDRMFVTDLNVMEVVIDREIDTIAEIDEVIELSEDALENTKDTEISQ